MPAEILLAIFRFTRPYIHQYSPSVILGPRNPWLSSLRTKKALALVCKAWSPPAAVVLYDDIVIRRMGQICALAHTLASSSRFNYAELVRSIRIDSCVVWKGCEDTIHEDLCEVLRRCTRLVSFSFHSHPEFPLVYQQRGQDHNRANGFNPTWFLHPRPGGAGDALRHRLDTGLRSLDVGFPITEETFSLLYSLLRHGIHLTSLTLDRIERTDLQDAQELPPLEFPELKTLRVDAHHEPLYRYVTDRWTMPQLTDLILMDFMVEPTDILKAHGSQLMYLFLLPRYPLDLPPPPVHEVVLPCLAELCPRIEHLVVGIPWDSLSSIRLRSPTLLYLDIDGALSFTLHDYKLIALAQDAYAPALRHIRFTPGYRWFFPQMCDPSLLLQPKIDIQKMSDDELDEVSLVDITSRGIPQIVPGELIRQSWWCVAMDPRIYLYYPSLQPWLNAAFEADDDDDNSSYVYESDSDIGSSDAWSGSDVEELPEREQEQTEQYDHETVVEMFRVGLQGDFLQDSSDEVEEQD